MFDELRIRCPFCFERQTLMVDPDGGDHQSLIVDCEICCHPMEIQVSWNEEKQKFKAEVARGAGFES